MKVQYPAIHPQGTAYSFPFPLLKGAHDYPVVAVASQVGTQPCGIRRNSHRHQFGYLYRFRKEKPGPVLRSPAAHAAQDNQQNGDKR